MENREELVSWLREMGYTGEMPESFVEIHNNSTSFVWEQLMQTVCPKDKAVNIKRNIILNRLKNKGLERQDEYVYKIKDIEVFRKKLELQNRLTLLREAAEEKQTKLQNLSQGCKLKEVSIDFLKNKIDRNEERNYLLDLKKEKLQIQNSEAEETLSRFKNVTPVEMESSNSSKEITETLEKCAQKLGEILTDNLKLSKENNMQSTFYTIKKKSKQSNTSSIASYMALREKEDFSEITRSCVKNIQNKENISPTEVKRNLFNIPKIIVEDVTKPETTVVVETKPKNRESLGLLSDLGDLNDSFSDFCKPLSLMNKLDASNVEVFDKTMQSSESSDSVVFNYKSQIEHSKGIKAYTKLIKDVYSDKVLNETLHSLLAVNNRKLLYDHVQKMMENLKVQFTKMVSVQNAVNSGKQKLNQEDIAKLQFIHIQTELKIIQQKRTLKSLVANIVRKKTEIVNFTPLNDETINEETLDLVIKHITLDANLNAMKKEINASDIEKIDELDLQIVQSKIFKVKNDIAANIHLIECAMSELKNSLKSLVSMKEKASAPLWHLRMFKTDSDWMQPLLENRWLEEMQVFRTFPMEYQRQCTFTDGKTFYRDLCIDNYPEDSNMEPEHLQMLCEILESPFSPPETVLLNIIKAKKKLEILRTLQNRNVHIPHRN
ncbi:uncharacterized protein LOC115880316 isoform X2 [Sitophilus oryzae]|nr:uncharacterized protein LOC115880316 isoform X2 [Sitophilus oryzae]